MNSGATSLKGRSASRTSTRRSCRHSLRPNSVAVRGMCRAVGGVPVARAGGINVVVPQESGYVPVDGGMESADGHCRPFDAHASGTVFSSGGGVVVLKRLEDALADRDHIWAVIRGVGVNNDGGDKVS